MSQAYINRDAWRQAVIKRLWVMFQIYNGGGLVNKEIKRAGGMNDWVKAKDQCRRGESCFTWKGQRSCRSNCDINYEYSVLVYKYGEKYASIRSKQYRYW